MTVSINQLLKQPNLPQLVEQAQSQLKNEAVRRQAFYEWIDEKMKAEFINGHIVIHSPATRKHNLIRKFLVYLIETFIDIFENGEVQDEKAMVHLTRNSFEPDICFWLLEKSQHFQEEQLLFPAPDFIVEVLSKGSVTRDRVDKMKDYALHGVQEYWIINPTKQIVEQYLLPLPEEQRYELKRLYSIEEDIESKVLKGFNIPVRAFFDSKVKAEVARSFKSP
jgi:Uma2 family endonuclease